MVDTIRIYFAHPIRGNTGTPREIAYNCRLAKAYAAFMRSWLGPGYDVYCPADHDEMPQIAWDRGTFKTEDILSADLAILDRCQMIVAGYWSSSKGVDDEVQYAITKTKPAYHFYDFTGLLLMCDMIGGTHWQVD